MIGLSSTPPTSKEVVRLDSLVPLSHMTQCSNRIGDNNMVCDTMLKPRQTLAQRKDEVRKRMSQIDKLLVSGRLKLKVGPQGAVVFSGLSDAERDGISDACIYRTITRSGSAAAKLAIQRQEMLAGRAVDRKALAHGVHSHDEGRTWSTH